MTECILYTTASSQSLFIPIHYTGRLVTTESRFGDVVSKSAREVLSNRQLRDAPHKKSIRISL
jgi:hypothetical protein